MELMDMIIYGGILAGAIVGFSLFLAMCFRVVVPTNEVHIVQSGSETKSFGKDTTNGNTYFLWPSWIPFIGITVTVFPTSVFELTLDSYQAYDLDRLPFNVDVTAFFRVDDSNLAAQRVAGFEELEKQLESIVQGAIRVIMASNKLEDIMQGRSKFGDEFTDEVREQLKSWGIAVVKNIEIMDIKDADGSSVIKNIMSKKISMIEMESRTEVAENKKKASMAEQEALRELEIQKQKIQEEIKLKQIDVERNTSIQEQEKQKVIAERQKELEEKTAETLKVKYVKAEEIKKETEVIKADAAKQTQIIKAQADLDTETLKARGVLENGKAKAEAEKLILMAPVEAQLTLAKEIGENTSYQSYLVQLEQIKATKEVGIAQAVVLEKAQIKLIANAGTPTEGLNKITDMFSSNGGMNLASMVEAFAQSENGEKIINKFLTQPKK